MRGCYKPAYRRNWCSMHYRRIIRYGGPGHVREMGKADTLENRFFDAVHIRGTCHIWCGSINKHGYGTIGFKNKKLYAHRVAWQLAYGHYPLGKIVWKCGHRLCVRADHLMEQVATRH